MDIALQLELRRFAEYADTCLLRVFERVPLCGHPLDLGLERT